MKAKLLVIFLMVVIVVACSKETFTDRPGLTLNSVNDTIFRRGDQITFKFTLTNKKGEKVTDTLFIRKKFFTCPFTTEDTAKYIIPVFDGTSNQKAEVEYAFVYGSPGLFTASCSIVGGSPRTDSLNFFFYVKDKRGNTSDTIKSPKIILLK